MVKLAILIVFQRKVYTQVVKLLFHVDISFMKSFFTQKLVTSIELTSSVNNICPYMTSA